MPRQIVKRGKNITLAQLYLLDYMDPVDVTTLISKTEELVEQIPDPFGSGPNRQGLMLGLIQSGKTGGLTTTIALASDNGYRCFVVLTSDNIWLYDQTMKRLKAALPGLQVVGKDEWERELGSMVNTLKLGKDGLVLVATKNAKWLDRLVVALGRLKMDCVSNFPIGLVIDDEADQASLDTRTNQRATNPEIETGRINDLITRIRNIFPIHAYLQVTATPQALFLQDEENPYRPEFTILIDPGKGYVGGSTFFSLLNGQGNNLIRNINQQELDYMISSDGIYVPPSLKSALCAFYVGAAIKTLQGRTAETPKPLEELRYTFLCHISQKKTDHNKAYDAISNYYQTLRQGLSSAIPLDVSTELRSAYDDIASTVIGAIPTFEEVWDELAQFIVGTEIQVLNSDKDQHQPSYDRTYNILIGGTKLARGVTIKNLLVTYYGRQAKATNMDTMLQHARMYGYREKDLDITRLFVTEDVAARFRLINDSEEALREIIKRYPNEVYRGIYIGQRLSPTRRNVLNSNNIGAYAAGSEYFPPMPVYQSADLQSSTDEIDRILGQLHPQNDRSAVRVTIKQLLEILKASRWAASTDTGLWDDARIITAIETLRKDAIYNDTGYLIVRRGRNVTPTRGKGQIGSVLAPTIRPFANKDYPSLFMSRLEGKSDQGWDGMPFWVPTLRFPDGRYALMFNFDWSGGE